MPSQPSQAAPSKIFISYRRAESAVHSGRLSDQLEAHFGSQVIFIDIDSIDPGRDFVEVIEEEVGSCKILLAVIGQQWLTCAGEHGRRLDDPNDFVRLEIAAALKRGIRVIPVLVQGAKMPRTQDLPDELALLSRRQAWEVRDSSWREDVRKLIGKIEGDIKPSLNTHHAPVDEGTTGGKIYAEEWLHEIAYRDKRNISKVAGDGTMSHLHHAGMPHNDGRSKAFLLGLYVGLSLLLLVSHTTRDPALQKATNIYGLQALAGATLGFWRIRKRKADPRTTPALASVLICFGLTLWAIGQGVWAWGTVTLGKDQYPWFSDIFYIGSNLGWLVALFYVFKSLRRRVLPAGSSYMVIVPAVLALFVSVFGFVDYYLIEQQQVSLKQQTLPYPLLTLVCDLVYIFLTLSSMLLAVALVVGENAEIPFPVHQCIRYLCFATAIDAGAILSFTVTVKLAENNPLAYFNGNWVDWLFLTAIYCWGVSALKCPIREEELRYTFGTKRTRLREEDIYRAGEIAQQNCANEKEAARVAAYTSSIRWILDNIPECWRVVKLGDLVVGSTFLFPVPQSLIDSLVAHKTTEREMFEEVKRNPLTWDYLYLADASILGDHRRRGLAFKCFVETIELKKSQNPEIKVCCRPNNTEEKGLANKLEKHFGIQILKVEGDDI